VRRALNGHEAGNGGDGQEQPAHHRAGPRPDGPPLGCARFGSTWDCLCRLRSGPRHGDHPIWRGAEPGAAIPSTCLPLSSRKGGQGAVVPQGRARPPTPAQRTALLAPAASCAASLHQPAAQQEGSHSAYLFGAYRLDGGGVVRMLAPPSSAPCAEEQVSDGQAEVAPDP
jgi:hypothetical protein